MNARQTFNRGIESAALSYAELGGDEIRRTVEPFRKEAAARLAAGHLSCRGARELVDQAREALAGRWRETGAPRRRRQIAPKEAPCGE